MAQKYGGVVGSTEQRRPPRERSSPFPMIPVDEAIGHVLKQAAPLGPAITKLRDIPAGAAVGNLMTMIVFTETFHSRAFARCCLRASSAHVRSCLFRAGDLYLTTTVQSPFRMSLTVLCMYVLTVLSTAFVTARGCVSQI